MSTVEVSPNRSRRAPLRPLGEPLGNDGLTDRERDEFARRYREGPGRRSFSDTEQRAIDEWLARRAGRALG